MTKFTYICKTCNFKKVISTDRPKTSKRMNINLSVALGSVNVGNSLTQLRELLASDNTHCMSYSTYRSNMILLLHYVKNCAEDLLKAAAAEERRLAVAANQFHNGVPWIYIVVDGAWMIRSYGTNYSWY